MSGSCGAGPEGGCTMSVKEGMSKFGKFLSGMVMPNIGAFIAWGFLTALFTGSGWLPNEAFAQMISPMLSYLIPVLIAAQGGYLVGGDRGRIIGAIAVIGCILGAPDYPMLMGAMAMGPLCRLGYQAVRPLYGKPDAVWL